MLASQAKFPRTEVTVLTQVQCFSWRCGTWAQCTPVTPLLCLQCPILEIASWSSWLGSQSQPPWIFSGSGACCLCSQPISTFAFCSCSLAPVLCGWNLSFQALLLLSSSSESFSGPLLLREHNPSCLQCGANLLPSLDSH